MGGIFHRYPPMYLRSWRSLLLDDDMVNLKNMTTDSTLTLAYPENFGAIGAVSVGRGYLWTIPVLLCFGKYPFSRSRNPLKRKPKGRPKLAHFQPPLIVALPARQGIVCFHPPYFPQNVVLYRGWYLRGVSNPNHLRYDATTCSHQRFCLLYGNLRTSISSPRPTLQHLHHHRAK